MSKGIAILVLAGLGAAVVLGSKDHSTPPTDPGMTPDDKAEYFAVMGAKNIPPDQSFLFAQGARDLADAYDARGFAMAAAQLRMKAASVGS